MAGQHRDDKPTGSSSKLPGAEWEAPSDTYPDSGSPQGGGAHRRPKDDDEDTE
ncbi:hypothetical protein [Streptomyces mayteni]